MHLKKNKLVLHLELLILHMHMVRVCMRLRLIGTAVSVKEKQETMTNSRLDWENGHKYLNQIVSSLGFEMRPVPFCKTLMCSCPLASCVVMLLAVPFTLYRAFLDVNNSAGTDTGALWGTPRERETERLRAPDPFDILTCYIISWGYSISPISLGS